LQTGGSDASEATTETWGGGCLTKSCFARHATVSLRLASHARSRSSTVCFAIRREFWGRHSERINGITTQLTGAILTTHKLDEEEPESYEGGGGTHLRGVQLGHGGCMALIKLRALLANLREWRHSHRHGRQGGCAAMKAQERVFDSNVAMCQYLEGDGLQLTS
jgi:hypothetical protein